MKRKKISIITGSRAEWGLFYPLAHELKKRKNAFQLSIVSSGAHLSSKHGLTYREIEKDGFSIDEKVRFAVSDDSERALALTAGDAVKGFTRALDKLKPHLVMLLGDRFEIFAAAAASLFLRIPIAHIHGGELTEGSIDDPLRHSITKMSSFHFVSSEIYRKRVIQMGEEPSTVFNVGALGLDNIMGTKLLDRSAFTEKTGFEFGKHNVVVTFNPSTAEDPAVSERQLANLLNALDLFDGAKMIFTKPNPDIYSSRLAGMIDSYVGRNRKRAMAFDSMGRVLYLSALNLMDLVAGNSSSGIIEAPFFSKPTVNIGDRQKGRIRVPSIIDTPGESVDEIKGAIRRAFSDGFTAICREVRSPYGNGGTAQKIAEILETVNIVPVRKRFYDIDFK